MTADAHDLLMQGAEVGYTYGALGREFAGVLPEVRRLADGAGMRLPPEDALARAITAEWPLIHSETKPTPLQIARALLARLAADPTIHRRTHDSEQDEAEAAIRSTTR